MNPSNPLSNHAQSWKGVILFTMLALAVMTSAYPTLLGDANDDGSVDIVDALVIAQAYVGTEGVSVHQLSADVNGDFSVDIVDALLVAQFYVGIITEFPIKTDSHTFRDSNIGILVRMALGKDKDEPVSYWELRKLSSLRLHELDDPDFSDLQYMLGLKEIDLSNSKDLDLNQLARVAAQLSSDQLPINSSSASIPIKYPSLIELNLNNTSLDDIQALSGLPFLKTLILSNNSIGDFSPLASLQDLSELDLNNTGCTNIQILTSLPDLKTLILSNNQIDDFNPLASLTNLTRLNLANTGLSGLAPLSDMSLMQSLNLSGNQVRDLGPLRNMVSLKDLDVSTNFLDTDGLSNMGVLNSLVNLNVSRNSIAGEEVLDDYRESRTIDFRLNPGTTPLPFAIPRRQVDLFACLPGSPKGDANGDRLLTYEDAAMVRALNPANTGSDMPDEIACLDMNSDGGLDELDAVVIEEMIGSGTTTLFGISCPPVYIKGDLDGDGRVTLDDADLMESLSEEAIAASADFSCADMDNNGRLEKETDGRLLRERAVMNSPPIVRVPQKEDAVNILTYDHDYHRWGGPTHFSLPEGSEAHGDASTIMAEGAILDIHERILNNPFLGETDLILIPEFAYADPGRPIVLKDNGDESGPRYEIANYNWITEKISELMHLAAEYKVNIVAPVIERIHCDNTPVIFNSALIINNQGEIVHIRRKTFATVGPPQSDKVIGICYDLSNNSHKVLELKTRYNRVFSSVLVICAEMAGDIDKNIKNAMEAYLSDSKKETLDLLLFSEMSFKLQRHVDIQRRIQYGVLESDIWVEAVSNSRKYISYVDFLGYAGGFPSNQGVFSMAGIIEEPKINPIDFTYAHQFDNYGYVFSRFTPNRP